jgi:glycosyltransferase involved in cell wall biosynthesis
MPRTNLKIALVSSATELGGSERVLWTLGTGLIGRGHEVLWVCGESSQLFQQIKTHGFSACPLPDPTCKPSAFLRLRSACVAQGVQIMLANDSQARTWGSIAMVGKLGVKRIQYKHNLKPPFSNVPYHWMLDHLVCVSDSVRNLCIANGIAESKLATIEIGLEMPQLEKWKERLWACEFLGIPQKTPLFCWMDQAAARDGNGLENLVQLIEATNHLRWHLPAFCVVVTCSPPQASQLQRLAIKYALHEHFRFVGYEAPERWICASDVLIQPGTNTGYSIAAIEAQRMGTKIVTLVNHGHRERFDDSASSLITDWQCNENDPSSLANSMAQAVDQQESSTATKLHALTHARTRFAPDRMVQDFEALFCKTLGIQQTRQSSEMDGQTENHKSRRAG